MHRTALSFVLGALPLVAGLGCSSTGDPNTATSPTGTDGAVADAAADGAAPADASTAPPDAAPDGPRDASAATSAADAGDAGADETLPWAGGSSYYAKWPHGPSTSPSFFPISVWLQSPSNAAAYAAIGINQYIGLYNTPTTADFTSLTSASVRVAFDQSSVGLAHVGDPIVFGWTQQDEPDNAQPIDGGYGPCVAPSTIQGIYATFTSKDPSRPVFLNVGQAVAVPTWPGRGSCSAQPQDYPKYFQGADIVSFDVYPVNDGYDLGVVAKGVDFLGQSAGYAKPVWNWIECTGINGPSGKPTPAQVKAEVWMSIIHGSMGIGYFVHQFAPTFDERALLDDAVMKPAVAAINAQITSLAPVLNTPPLKAAASATSSAAGESIDVMARRSAGATYVFAVAMGSTPATGSFQVTKLPAAATADVLGESRQIPVSGGAFTDTFAGWGVHLYRIQ